MLMAEVVHDAQRERLERIAVAGELQGELKDARREGEEVHAELVRATEQAGQAEVRAVEIERRADDLRAELRSC